MAMIPTAEVAGLVGMDTIPRASYGASKRALIGLTRHLAAQWSGVGVRVNALAPGLFPRDMTESSLADEARGGVDTSEHHAGWDPE